MKKALIVVDVQNDFCPGGALGVKDGDQVVPIILKLISAKRLFPSDAAYLEGRAAPFHLVVATMDWHPDNHCSFADPPQFKDGSWPKHCVQNTEGAKLHPGLSMLSTSTPMTRIVTKGMDPDREEYSGATKQVIQMLEGEKITHVYVCGLAFDYCVKATALDLAKHFDTTVIGDACQAVDPKTEEMARQDMVAAGIRFEHSGKLLDGPIPYRR